MSKIGNICRAIGGRLVGLFLNRKMRRMILVVSAATYLHTLNRSGTFKLSELNDECKLTFNAKALDFPSAISKNIWEGSELENIDISDGHDSIVKKIVDNIPPWLIYGRRDDMVADIDKAVTYSLG